MHLTSWVGKGRGDMTHARLRLWTVPMRGLRCQVVWETLAHMCWGAKRRSPPSQTIARLQGRRAAAGGSMQRGNSCPPQSKTQLPLVAGT